MDARTRELPSVHSKPWTALSRMMIGFTVPCELCRRPLSAALARRHNGFCDPFCEAVWIQA